MLRCWYLTLILTPGVFYLILTPGVFYPHSHPGYVTVTLILTPGMLPLPSVSPRGVLCVQVSDTVSFCDSYPVVSGDGGDDGCDGDGGGDGDGGDGDGGDDGDCDCGDGGDDEMKVRVLSM